MRSTATTLTVGEKAPNFFLPDQTKTMRSLKDCQNKWLALYFYPKDDTPGCARQARGLRDDFVKIKELGAQVVGISVDNAESHAAFAEKYSLPFPLLADSDGKVAKAYGSLWPIPFIKIAKRHAFIIDPGAKIAKIYRNVSPKNYSKIVITDLKRLVGN